jgi:DNA-binding MarR family transcriptional regulator
MSPNDLRDEAFVLLGRVMTRSDPGRLEAFAGLGLTMTQLRVLFLVRQDEGISAGTLAETLSVTPSTLTRIMDRLVSGGLVQREPDETDRRLVRHRLTARGRHEVEDLERTARARVDAILERLSPAQIERLVMALRDLNEATEAVDTALRPKVEA